MINNQLLTILQRVLGKSTTISKGDESFYCPICHHHKQKLIINVDDSNSHFGSWHCWVCNNGSKGILPLLRKAEKELFPEEISIINDIFKLKSNKKIEESKTQKQNFISLPKEYKSLLLEEPNNPEYRNAIHYILNKRNLTKFDIRKYNIGYCDEGKYAGRIIIPSYDANNQLNYFQARVYYDDADCKKFENPDIEYNNIIAFESHINWNEPIVLCEAAFDAIAIRHNAIPCFGKNISDALNKKIYSDQVKAIYIFLDPDAIKNILTLAELYFYKGIDIYIINYTTNDDASKLGYIKCQQLIRNATKLNENLLLKLKIQHK